jgi:hypothetical protein
VEGGRKKYKLDSPNDIWSGFKTAVAGFPSGILGKYQNKPTAPFET